jgi:hypothetical protein
MPLSVGDRLGPYQILAAIGAGGMGEVYEAPDLSLKKGDVPRPNESRTRTSERSAEQWLKGTGP